jgi:hypothetical protein
MRALTIKSVKEQADYKKKDLASVQAARERAMKFNMTSRALGIVAARNQKNVAKALDPDVSPSLARKMVEAAAFYQAEAEAEATNPNVSEKDRLLKAASLVDKSAELVAPGDAEEEAPAEDKHAARRSVVRPQEMRRSAARAGSADKEDKRKSSPRGSVRRGEAPPVAAAASEAEAEAETEPEREGSVEGEGEGQVIVMEELAKAVAQGDEEGVNRAILKDFLEEHAPERVDEVEKMLESEGGNVDKLFTELVEQYPDPAEKTEGEGAESGSQSKSGEEDEDGVDQVEAQRREAEDAARKEQARVEAMPSDEREAYEEDKRKDAEHVREKDAMLKQQLDVYAKGGAKKSPALANARRPLAGAAAAAGAGAGAGASAKADSKADVADASKRLSKKVVESAGATKNTVAGNEGFILSAKVGGGGAAGSRNSAGRVAGSAKWAVNVQPQLLRERLRKAGVADKDIEAVMAEESEMM